MFTMTFNEALLIQRSQIVYYRQHVGRKGVKAIQANTIYPVGLNPNEQLDVSVINELVPRGGSFERYITGKVKNIDPLNIDWMNAVRRGFI